MLSLADASQKKMKARVTADYQHGLADVSQNGKARQLGFIGLIVEMF